MFYKTASNEVVSLLAVFYSMSIMIGTTVSNQYNAVALIKLMVKFDIKVLRAINICIIILLIEGMNNYQQITQILKIKKVNIGY